MGALEFYKSYNGAAYNLLEPDSLCHAVWVSEIERGGDGVPPVGHTELPNCPGTIYIYIFIYNIQKSINTNHKFILFKKSLFGAHG